MQDYEACAAEQHTEPYIERFVDQTMNDSPNHIIDQPTDCSSEGLVERSTRSVLEHSAKHPLGCTRENCSQEPPHKAPLDEKRHVLNSCVLHSHNITIEVETAPIHLPHHLTKSLYPLCYPQGRAVACCNRDARRALVGLSSVAISKRKLFIVVMLCYQVPDNGL